MHARTHISTIHIHIHVAAMPPPSFHHISLFKMMVHRTGLDPQSVSTNLLFFPAIGGSLSEKRAEFLLILR